MQIPIHELRTIIVRSLVKLGHSESHASIIADCLLYAELRGNNQGIIKIVAGALSPSPLAGSHSSTTVEFETPVSARINGNNLIGMVVVSEALEIALRKCATSGIAIVGCSGYASATGALGYWGRKIAEAGYIGMVMSQCNEMVAPHGSYEPIFGTNPISISIPTTPRAQVLDMATSAYAYYGIKLAEQKGETIPNDIAYDKEGHPTTNPTAALAGAIRSFDRSYKGSHLALVVELLGGAFTGAAMENKGEAKNWGSLILAISPDLMGNREEFIANANRMCDRVKHAKPLPDQSNRHSSIYLPGERGDEVEAERLKTGSIEISSDLIEQLRAIADGPTNIQANL